VYVASSDSPIPHPAKELKGFVKINLKPGEQQHVTVPLDTRSFAYFDAKQGLWQAPAGRYKVLVGTSSEESKLSDGIHLSRTLTEKP
jgi:beta-glucosidase